MPAAAEPDGAALVDTSVAVPLLVADHDHHDPVADAVGDRLLGLAGHAAFETFSVLTRLPPHRRAPALAARVLAEAFPLTHFPAPSAVAGLIERMGTLDIAGGAVYDALIAAAVEDADLFLISRDKRALSTYRAFGIRVEMLD